jgi:hypothetical protein
LIGVWRRTIVPATAADACKGSKCQEHQSMYFHLSVSLGNPSDLDADTGTRFIASRDLSRTVSCPAATEATGACGCHRRRLEAQENLGQQTHPLRRSRFHCYRLPYGRRKSHILGKTGIETLLRYPRHERTRWRCRRLRTEWRSWPGPQRHCRSFAGRRGNGRGQLPVDRHGPGCVIGRRNKRRFGRTLDESRRVVRRPTDDTRRPRPPRAATQP